MTSQSIRKRICDRHIHRLLFEDILNEDNHFYRIRIVIPNSIKGDTNIIAVCNQMPISNNAINFSFR